MTYHHFASKEDLLVAALAPPEGAASALRPIPAETPDPGAAVVSAVVEMWENDSTLREQALAMLRTALSYEHAAQRVRDVHTSAVLTLVANVVAVDDRELRATLIGAQLIGVLLSRYLLKTNTLAGADPADLITALTPVINHYLTGDLVERGPGKSARVKGRSSPEFNRRSGPNC